MPLAQFLPPIEIALKLEPEELAVYLLRCLIQMEQRGGPANLNLNNFLGTPELDDYADDKYDEAVKAITEAWIWLEREGMIAPIARQGRDWLYVTRRGMKLAEDSDITGYIRSNLIPKESLDPVLASKVIHLFIRGDYDTAVFQAFKEVEIRVRNAASLSPEEYGTDLMRKVFHPETGVLTDTGRPMSERQATSDLFAGLSAYLRILRAIVMLTGKIRLNVLSLFTWQTISYE